MAQNLTDRDPPLADYIGLVRTLPPMMGKVWLVEVLIGCFWFNVALFIEQVATN